MHSGSMTFPVVSFPPFGACARFDRSEAAKMFLREVYMYLHGRQHPLFRLEISDSLPFEWQFRLKRKFTRDSPLIVTTNEEIARFSKKNRCSDAIAKKKRTVEKDMQRYRIFHFPRLIRNDIYVWIHNVVNCSHVFSREWNGCDAHFENRK